ncbi:MAG TPA: aromatic amino acid ammonia-lyase [Acidimicrobiia bacterium]|nr:aromatic amino acid ammonia-lyase [Acidimicrobiia bacterium]
MLDGSSLTIDGVAAVAREQAPVRLTSAPAVRRALQASLSRRRALTTSGIPVYGITTGFGDSVNRQIPPAAAAALQEHLVRFLGNGTGPHAPLDAARAAVVIRANSLVRGHSGVRIELVERLVELLNRDIVPVIPEEGSVGASGDLVPLSYLAAAVVGQRRVLHRGRLRPTADALQDEGLEPLTLEPKEGLALVNGTAFMTAFAALAAVDARRLATVSDVCTALCTEVLGGITGPFDPFLHDVAKPHPGQVASAANIRAAMAGSRLARSYDDVVGEAGRSGVRSREMPVHIQDKYSLRCAPHYTGVLWDTLEWVDHWLTTEINSSNDNPLFDPDSGRVLSGGNFSGGHVALAMDALKTAVASVADLMDRQLELVVDEKFNQGLTPNLIPRFPDGHPEQGLNHGFKGMQLACSSLTAEALSRCMPVSAFSRSTECHNQDKVSMGATAARHARDVVALAEKVAAIHLLALCQAADLRGPKKLGRGSREVYEQVRSVAGPLASDRPMDGDLAAVLDLVHSGALNRFNLARRGPG